MENIARIFLVKTDETDLHKRQWCGTNGRHKRKIGVEITQPHSITYFQAPAHPRSKNLYQIVLWAFSQLGLVKCAPLVLYEPVKLRCGTLKATSMAVTWLSINSSTPCHPNTDQVCRWMGLLKMESSVTWHYPVVLITMECLCSFLSRHYRIVSPETQLGR